MRTMTSATTAARDATPCQMSGGRATCSIDGPRVLAVIATLLVGAGGAGSAIAVALLEAGVRELIIHDADDSRVATLLELLSDIGQGRVSAGPPDPIGCDLVCNADPHGHGRE